MSRSLALPLFCLICTVLAAGMSSRHDDAYNWATTMSLSLLTLFSVAWHRKKQLRKRSRDSLPPPYWLQAQSVSVIHPQSFR